MKAVVFTLGCKVNSCESSSLINGLNSLGYETSDELGYADVFIINTCAVTAEAEKKSRQAIARARKFNPDCKIIVTGCASEKNPHAFSGKDNVTLVTGTKAKDKILSMLSETGEKNFRLHGILRGVSARQNLARQGVYQGSGRLRQFLQLLHNTVSSRQVAHT